MSVCENIDGQCSTSWCDCDYQRRKRNSSLGESAGSAVSEAVDMLRAFEEGVDANFTGPENAGHRGWLKIHIHNIIIKLGRKPYVIHEQNTKSSHGEAVG